MTFQPWNDITSVYQTLKDRKARTDGIADAVDEIIKYYENRNTKTKQGTLDEQV